MIVFIFSKLLQWMYGWGEFTHGTKCFLTGLSAVEFFLFIAAVIGFCVIELPDILKERKRKKEQSKWI